MTARDVTGRTDIRPEVVASRIVHRGRVVTLRVDDVRLPDGRIVVREVVDHPGAVVIAALDAHGCVTLVRQYRHAVGDRLLELPAGTLEPGEEPLETAMRELREEAGLVAGRWDRLGTFFSSPGFLREEMHAFLARELRSVTGGARDRRGHHPGYPQPERALGATGRTARLEEPGHAPTGRTTSCSGGLRPARARRASGHVGGSAERDQGRRVSGLADACRRPRAGDTGPFGGGAAWSRRRIGLRRRDLCGRWCDHRRERR